MNDKSKSNCVLEESSDTCSNFAVQYADISMGVKVLPYAEIESVSTKCCKNPTITVCKSCDQERCEMIIKQTVQVKIAIKYGASVENCGYEVKCVSD